MTTTDTPTRWLTPEELASFLPLAGVMLRLGPTLDSQLQRDSELTHFDYLCLAMLSEQEDWTLTMSALAAKTNSSLSRLSHVITKLEKRGWVSRARSEESRRVTLVTMTEPGYAVLVDAAPKHVGFVYALIYDGLSAEDIESLRRIMTHVLERIEGSGLKSTVC